MTLGELINRLEMHDKRRIIPNGFGNPHSYRGIYSELAFAPAKDMTVGEMLDLALEALGNTYQGWKGGWFTMTQYTKVHLAHEGEVGETIGPILLGYILAE